ncbi:hypothetical protein [uncultured Helicobacter sp.]|uniref:hypothetical protein n=1 Tax=uncultured Helicobacter sp. TaxID=175537 RepID=UPI0026181F6A|nr:hypothetical protein [uncultured Helicobacter sp.]
MSVKALKFFDTQSQSLYTLANNRLIIDSQKPTSVDIASPTLSHFTHLSLEVEKAALKSAQDSAHISSLLFSLAYQQSALHKPPYAYGIYFIPREHSFDEEKCIYETCFYEKYTFSPKASIITSDIFLPSALAAFEMKENRVIWIESYLCYFENNALKEVLHCELGADNTYLQSIALHIAYLQEAYHQYFTHLYYFMPDALVENAAYLDLSTTTHHGQTLPIKPLSEICNDTRGLTFETLKATLALHYAMFYQNQTLNLPNFASKPSAHKKLYVSFGIVAMIFLYIFPLALMFYNQHLQEDISSLNAKSESLFASQSIVHNTLEQENLQALTRKQNMLIKNLHDIALWQQSYHLRYDFMQEVLKPQESPLIYEGVSFHFTPHIFVALLEISAPNQIHISTLLATLNTPTQKAFLQDSIKETFDTDNKSSHFYAHIVVVYNVI